MRTTNNRYTEGRELGAEKNYPLSMYFIRANDYSWCVRVCIWADGDNALWVEANGKEIIKRYRLPRKSLLARASRLAILLESRANRKERMPC